MGFALCLLGSMGHNHNLQEGIYGRLSGGALPITSRTEHSLENFCSWEALEHEDECGDKGSSFDH